MPLKPARIWIEPETQEGIPDNLLDLVADSSLLAQAIWRRGVRSAEAARAFLDPNFYNPRSPSDLPGLDEVADRLETAISHKEPICVWGDFDVDGQTATTVLVSTLRDLGAAVSYHIPVRGPESHGVNLPRLENIIHTGAKVILTCDTGIAAHDAVQLSAQYGVDFLITDHHELPAVLPSATAIVNPRLLPTEHPLAALPGVGVAFKLAEELYRRAGRAERAEPLLDLVALGIVADIATLQSDTRYLLQQGLGVLREARRPAIRAMLDFAGLDPLFLTEEHIGFTLGPRLNSLGRLGDANPVVEFFLSTDLPRVRVLAQQLEGLNAERQLKTQQVFKAAIAALEQDPSLLKGPVIVLAHPHWPAGIIGIVASRLVEVFGKPVVLLTVPPGEQGRGSARSVSGINITAAIANVQASQSDLVHGFGGHPMAAGLSLDSERVEDFRRALWLAARDQVGEDLPPQELRIDGTLPLSAATLEFAGNLERLAPFGAGNPPLILLARNLLVKRNAGIGREAEHRVLTVEDETGEIHKVIWWNGAGFPGPEGKFNLAYTLRATTFNGHREAQLQWVDFQPVEESSLVLNPSSSRQVIDCREVDQPLAHLRQFVSQGEVVVWCEGEAKSLLAKNGIQGHYRHELSACENLVIWSTPPGRPELRAAIGLVNPKTVAIFGIDPEFETVDAFLKRLAGLVKFTLTRKSGSTSLPMLAAATGQRQIAVRLGLDWLVAKGHIIYEELAEGEVFIRPGEGGENETTSDISSQLSLVFEETTIFRTYFKQAAFQDLQILIT